MRISVRNKSNEGVVCDIVVEKDDNGDFFLSLRSYPMRFRSKIVLENNVEDDDDYDLYSTCSYKCLEKLSMSLGVVQIN